MVCLVDGSNTGCRDASGGDQIAPIKPDMPETTVVPPGGSPQVPGSDAPVKEHPATPTSTTIAAVIKAVKTPTLGAFASPITNAGDQPKPSALDPSNTYDQPPSASKSPSSKEDPADSTGGGGVSGVYTGPSDISAPHYVVYSDAKFPTGKLPTAEELGGFNRFLLCFWMVLTPATEKMPPQPMAPFDNAAIWAEMAKSERSALKASYKAKGIAVMVSAFGATDTTVTQAKAELVAEKLAAFVIANDLDGVDCDYEDLFAFGAGTALDWIIKFHNALRAKLPAPYIISHAPLAPWFIRSAASTEVNVRDYAALHASVGSSVDFYNIQFYNNGLAHTTCETLLDDAAPLQAGSAVADILKAGVSPNQLVIGKPLEKKNTGSPEGPGHMEPALLAKCYEQAKGKVGGIMFWQWPPGETTAVDALKLITGAV